jgi:hypothetical protein
MPHAAPSWMPWTSAARISAVRADISPPLGFPSRNWAASDLAVNAGQHRPLTATAVSFVGDSGSRCALVSLDLGWWRRAEDELQLRERVLAESGLSPGELLIHLVHTHAGPYTCAEPPGDGPRPVADYLDALAGSVAAIVTKSLDAAEPAMVTWAYGSCALAVNRDLPVDGREVIAFNPDRAADDTLLVGRITRTDGTAIATLVNYACHPTTLSWQNALVSPDWVGAAREIVEDATGAPCVVLQGASGDLSPRDQATADVSVADRNGRQVGYAALSALENMLPAGQGLVLTEVVESGAPLGIWSGAPAFADPAIRCAQRVLRLPLQPPELAAGPRRGPELTGAVARERQFRRACLSDSYVEGPHAGHPVWAWRLGAAGVIAHPGEAFSALQTSLRARHPAIPLLVLNCTNGPGFVYLPPAADYQCDKYQVWQSLVGPGGLEQLADGADALLQDLWGAGDADAAAQH